jgi:hypothetical protein
MPESTKQIEVENLLRSTSGKEISSEMIDQIVNMIKEQAPDYTSLEDTETNIKLKLLNETDWKKRASLAALLISNSLK